MHLRDCKVIGKDEDIDNDTTNNWDEEIKIAVIEIMEVEFKDYGFLVCAV